MTENNSLQGAQAKGVGTVSNPNQPMKERIISERVVSEKVLGSSNPIARFGRNAGKQISSRFSGIGLGIILILASFIVVWYSENLNKSAATVAELPVLTVEQAVGQADLVKVQGKVTSAPIKAPLANQDVIYYHHVREELEMVTETETETKVITRDGQDVEQTIEREVERPKWVVKTDDVRWADLVLDNKISIKPDGSKQLLNLNKVYSMSEEKVRDTVSAVLPADDLIVVGSLGNNEISSGNPFIITNSSNDVLVQSLESSEKTTWWIFKLLTLVLFGLGLYSLLGPILLVLDAIPFLGNIGKSGLFMVCMLVGLIFTVLSSLIIAYWYVVLILLAGLVFYLFSWKKQQPSKSV